MVQCGRRPFGRLASLSRPSLLFLPEPVTCAGYRLPHGFTCISFLRRSGDATGRGALPPLPTTGPRPLHTCPGSCLASVATAASWPWGPRTAARSHHPAPPRGPASSQVPFWPLRRSKGQARRLGVSAFCWGPCARRPVPSFRTRLPHPGACCTCAARGGGAVGAPHTLPTSPSSQPLPHLRGFSDAGSHAPCCPQLEVGRPALKLTASPKGPLQGGVGEP